jgi:hypothetical protein
MPTQVGAKACDFAYNTTTNGITISGTGVGTFLLQSSSTTYESKLEEVMNAAGDTVQRAFYDPSVTATLEYVINGTSIADAKTQTTMPLPGVIVSITACASHPQLVASNWVVESSPTLSKSNTSFGRVTLNLRAHSGITAATT